MTGPRPADDAQWPSVTEAMIFDASAGWLSEVLPSQVADGGPQDGGFDSGHRWCDGRTSAFTLANVIAARCCADRLRVDVEPLDRAILAGARFLVRRQDKRGRIDLNGLFTANEVGFTLPALAAGLTRLAGLQGSGVASACEHLEVYLKRGAEAVMGGAAYTPNHRWAAACAPLAAVHAIWPEDRYLARIEEYLADGIDCDADGCWYLERSPNYNMVADHGLLVLAAYLNRPELLDHVRRNLEFILLNVQPNGEVDSSYSHRADRAVAGCPPATYRVARRAAQLFGDGRMSTLANQAWAHSQSPMQDLVPVLYDIDQHGEELPSPEALPTRYVLRSGSLPLVRVRTGETAITLTADRGGHHAALTGDSRVGGRSDDWIHIQHRGVVIQSIQLAASYMTNLQPGELAVEEEGAYRLEGTMPGWEHLLHFRPGGPRVAMAWNWDYSIRVKVDADRLHLKLTSDSPETLLARLHFWVRPGVRVGEGAAPARPLEAGGAMELAGGNSLTMSAPLSAGSITITGLPRSQHDVPIDNPAAIPSTMKATCALVTLGLLFPLALDLEFQLT